MSTSPTTASMTVATGTDRGKTFVLNEEFIHVGSGSDSQVLLTDSDVAEHVASLANRNGRFAIFTPIDGAVSVDGNPLVADQWVWLPNRAAIRVAPSTSLTFFGGGAESNSASNSASSTQTQTKLPVSAPSAESPSKTTATEKKRVSKKGESTTARRAVAKFITDRPGETLVRLGEDGHLPELSLQETTAPKVTKGKASQGNPALVYGALGFSLLASMAMLFVDPPALDEKASTKAEVRQKIKRFIGDESGPTTQCQKLLREAGLAHSRGDFVGERSAYLNVLALLNSEDRNPYTGITGSPDMDDELRKYLAVLMSR